MKNSYSYDYDMTTSRINKTYTFIFNLSHQKTGTQESTDAQKTDPKTWLRSLLR